MKNKTFTPRHSSGPIGKAINPKQGLYNQMNEAISKPGPAWSKKTQNTMKPEKQSSFLLTIGWAILVVFALLILLNVI